MIIFAIFAALIAKNSMKLIDNVTYTLKEDFVANI